MSGFHEKIKNNRSFWKDDDMADIGANPDHFTGGMIAMTWDQGLNQVSAVQAQVVKDIGPSKTSPHNLGFALSSIVVDDILRPYQHIDSTSGGECLFCLAM
jgi:hypothetical protein